MNSEDEKRFQKAYLDASPEAQEKLQAIFREYGITNRDLTEEEIEESAKRVADILRLDRASRASRRRSLTSMLRLLREGGWRVAVHNDYQKDGKLFTFWLFTNPSGKWHKGEAESDEDAVWEVYDRLYKEAPVVRKCSECGETMPLDPKMACVCSVQE